jgi:mRNA interferase MazF
VAPITSTVRGLSTEVPVGPENGVEHHSVVSCDNVVTIPTTALGRQIGRLLPDQEIALTAALHAAFDLENLPPPR